MNLDTYEVWCDEVGIIPDTESREAWEHQQEKIDKLTKTLFMLQVGLCNCVTKTNDASGGRGCFRRFIGRDDKNKRIFSEQFQKYKNKRSSLFVIKKVMPIKSVQNYQNLVELTKLCCWF